MKKLRTLLLLLSPFLYSSAFAIDYVFTGSGVWTDPANWEGGVVPPASSGGRIIIKGTTETGCFVGAPGCTDPNGVYFYSNSGTLIVEAGAKLTVNNGTQFENHGAVIVNGTLVNSTHWEAYMGSSITVNGTYRNYVWIGNQGLVTVNSGGTIENSGSFLNNFVNPGQLVVNTGGKIINSATFTFPNDPFVNGIFVNKSTFSGNVTLQGSLSNEGTLAPGNSPGIIKVLTNYDATATSVHNFEVGGTASSTYDQLQVGGNVLLNGTLNVSLINGFVPGTTDVDLPIINGTISGTFATVNIPSQYQLVYNSNSVVLRANATLPVTFFNVDVKKEAAGAKLTWRLQTEENVSHYDVEKSSDGRGFAKIGEVKAAAQGVYSFVDANAGSKGFYRIRSVDRDRKYSYSIVVTYSGGKGSVALNIYPSPANSTVNIQHAATTATHRIIISTVDGREVQTVFPAAGAQKTTVDVSTFSKGTYIIRYYSDKGRVESGKFIKH